ncbi:MAG: tRNA lysidine(34) synthetase TilS [candidate division Zixibacteria bacterium]|nr:tRNA lysidine(34) synthetase TilS [candidate division Zixibacteria bacterium]
MKILRKFEETLSKWNMLKKGDKVIVACSGGPDSTTLLYLLNQLKEKYNLKLIIAHINHKLRGKESNKDEKFVNRLADRLKLEFYSKSFDVKKIARKEKLSIEECARKIRYDYLNELANRINATKIALGHNADDQAETVLMRLFRGAGGLGLSGIPKMSGKIIRPLLDLKREEIEQFLERNKVGFRIDSSNLRKDYFRNRVRLELIPLLRKSYNPKIVDALNRTASILSAQEKFLKEETFKVFNKIVEREDKKISLDLDKLFNYDIYFRRALVRHAITQLGDGVFKSNFERIERILDLAEEKKVGRRVFLSKTLLAEISSDYLNLYQVEKKKKGLSIVFPGIKRSKRFKLNMDSEIILRKNWKEKTYTDDQMVAFLDWDKLKLPFILRNPESGDKFKPLGMKGTKSLKDFLTDLKVPRYEKERALVLTSKGKIVWVLGHRIADEFKITKDTTKILKIKAEKS